MPVLSSGAVWLSLLLGLTSLNNSFLQGYTVHYWRNGNDEVDFVLERRGKVIGLEIKSGVSLESRRNESAFSKHIHPDKVLLIGKSGIPWEEFLKINPAEIFNPAPCSSNPGAAYTPLPPYRNRILR